MLGMQRKCLQVRKVKPLVTWYLYHNMAVFLPYGGMYHCSIKANDNYKYSLSQSCLPQDIHSVMA